MENLISIILPSFNKAPFIEETLKAIISQSYPNWELIVVDDDSTDGTQEIITKIQQTDNRIRIFLNKKNNGANLCRNLGLKDAKGSFVIFLDADDLLMPFCLEQRVNQIASHANHDVWVFPMGVFQTKIGDVHPNNYWFPPENGDFLSLFLKHQLPWQTMQPIWNKDFLISIGGFDETFQRLQDVELHTRALLEKARVITFPKLTPDAYYRIDEKRTTTSKFNFYKRFVEATIQYYEKFYNTLTNDNLKLVLSHTLFEVLSLVIHEKKQKHLSGEEFTLLSNGLINACHNPNHIRVLRLFVSINNLLPFHVKGVKFALKKVLQYAA